MDVSLGEGPCPCPTCGRSERSSPTPQPWYKVRIDSACHVLYNSQEALATKVDFFYDSQKSRDEGFLENFKTCKRNLPKKIPTESLIVVVSHPHGQPKKITLGSLVKYKVNWAEPRAYALTWTLSYKTDTCPGSSGAPVFEVSSDTNNKVFGKGTFHSGCRSTDNHSVSTYTAFRF
ncbi:hypothetical protein RRG08_058860 [Elysia crispata]|uniref:Uncharacterized protein n=1 Tax=Elysia crispata TaxID=231223 RepID=A0AAE1CQ68_9GAST|nr:hypothetical protein RRG08_058860 [Elysia crispata]